MKKFVSILLLALAGLPLSAFERCYLSTDRGVYVAGDNIWCSAFCLDSAGRFSDASSVAYVELCSVQGTAAVGKIALRGGRGAGVIPIPLDIPTGNYRIVAYTALQKQESGFDPVPGSRVVSVFNTVSTVRVPGGVEIVHDYAPAKARTAASGELFLEVKDGVLSLNMSDSASVSVSIFHDDGIVAPSAAGPVEFLAAMPSQVSYIGSPEPEFDGEVVRATLYGPDAARVCNSVRSLAIISSPGSAGDTYMSPIGRDGKVVFHTNNIYGDRDLVCEILGMEGRFDCHFEPDDPFLRPAGVQVPSLNMAPSMLVQLENRSRAMLSERGADTLYEFLPKRENLLLNHQDCIVYKLDDYVRFNTLQDIIIEIVPELRVRRGPGGAPQLRMVLRDARTKEVNFSHNVLALLDGIPVTDVQRLLDFDAVLLGEIHLFPYTYSLGGEVFEGVVDFVTTKGDIASLSFDGNVRIVDFVGASYPVAYTCAGFQKNDRDMRQLLYWNPLLEVKGRQSVSLPFVLPSYKGKFRAVVDGFTVSGAPVHAEIEF